MAERVTRTLPALNELASWIRANADVLPAMLTILQAGDRREAPP